MAIISDTEVHLKLPIWSYDSICCPVCGSDLRLDNELECLNPVCRSFFPVVGGIPVLIDEKRSIFLKDDYIRMKETYYTRSRNGFSRTVLKTAPKIGANIKGKGNYNKLAELLLADLRSPKILVLGGGVFGKGIERLFDRKVEVIETDISFGPRTTAIIDAHCIPFRDDSFDCVVVQAVLEHVVEPSRCVEEIHRVLNNNGIVYAETAFMQQVHGGNFDFTRFTHLGHRRLFRQFQKIDSGAVCGTGMALAWSYERFLTSLIRSSTVQVMARLFARYTAFWLKYFDYLTIDNPATLDNASACYFLGRKSDKTLNDRLLVRSYER